MYGTSIKPQRALGTRWIDYKINAIIDKYGLYVLHLQHFIALRLRKLAVQQ